MKNDTPLTVILSVAPIADLSISFDVSPPAAQRAEKETAKINKIKVRSVERDPGAEAGN